MNALVGIRTGNAGTLSVTPHQRADVAQKLLSTARANLLGRMLTGATMNKALKTTSADLPSQELGKDVFLELLVNQMRYQDPLEPVSNENMIAQLAQFSALEQMTNLNESFTALSGHVNQLNFISAAALLGREVKGVDLAGQPIEGVVERIETTGSEMYLTVGDRRMSLSGVIGVETAS
ncbi:MAG: flagellar hook assembly protein FlgD [Candidatus Hydrogenedentes bacterium]|nr:flagellar hook assembly protein FlgD [Candidatus Hydrogenedentota bacterium]